MIVLQLFWALILRPLLWLESLFVAELSNRRSGCAERFVEPAWVRAAQRHAVARDRFRRDCAQNCGCRPCNDLDLAASELVPRGCSQCHRALVAQHLRRQRQVCRRCCLLSARHGLLCSFVVQSAFFKVGPFALHVLEPTQGQLLTIAEEFNCSWQATPFSPLVLAFVSASERLLTLLGSICFDSSQAVILSHNRRSSSICCDVLNCIEVLVGLVKTCALV